jgi:hypothetical protein
VGQLKLTKTEHDYERALIAAETGISAYLNRLALGLGGTQIQAMSLVDFRKAVFGQTVALTRYPAGSQQGYYVGHVGVLGPTGTVIAYGWSNGIVRRVRAKVRSLSFFEKAAVFALNPSTTSSGLPDNSSGNYAWRASGSASFVGPCGAVGRIDYSSNNSFYDGPILLSGPSARFGNGIDAPLLQSGPNLPAGHTGTGTLASPPVQRFAFRFNIPTVDQSANKISGTTQGVEWFRTHNNNSTGMRYLVQHKTTLVVRELPGAYVLMLPGDYALDGEFNPTNSVLTGLGMTGSEVFYGIRLYPGDYYFDQIRMQAADRLIIRSFSDGERAALGKSAEFPNPNPGQSDNATVHVWLGHRTGGDVATSFNYQTNLEYTRYPSRFRVYSATTAGVGLNGLNQNPPPPFRVNLLAYNQTASGSYYGEVGLTSGTYLFGSLVGWQVSVGGSSTIEAAESELTTQDQLTYVVTEWTELP